MLHQGEDHRTVRGNEDVLFQAAGLTQTRVPGEGLNGEVHVFLDLGRIIQRVSAGHPHAFVQGDTDRVSELLQGHGAVLVVVVFRELGNDIGRGLARHQAFHTGVHGFVRFAVQIDFLLGHLSFALHAAHEVDVVATRSNGVDVDDQKVALADDLVGRPTAVRAGVATGSNDDVVDDLAAFLQHELVNIGFDLTFGDARLEPFVLDLPHGGIADGRSLLQAFDFVLRLDQAGLRHGRPTVDDVHTGFLKGFQRRHVEVVDTNAFFFNTVVLKHFEDTVGHLVGHVLNGAFRPLPGHGRADTILHPRQVDNRTLHVGTGGFEQNGLTTTRQNRITDVDVVFPVTLVGTGDVTNVGTSKENQCAQVKNFHLFTGARQSFVTHAFVINSDLPVCALMAVQTPRVGIVRLMDKI